ncbi:hypothetical protein JB92DRAFT_486996 [Gautieria morchelliformis]|nr:hypothetical protein JB92DRAFT_486996 [Gautieria morchelliformis]
MTFDCQGLMSLAVICAIFQRRNGFLKVPSPMYWRFCQLLLLLLLAPLAIATSCPTTISSTHLDLSGRENEAGAKNSNHKGNNSDPDHDRNLGGGFGGTADITTGTILTTKPTGVSSTGTTVTTDCGGVSATTTLTNAVAAYVLLNKE